MCCGSTSFACSPPPPTLIRLRLNGQYCSARLTVAAATTKKRKGQIRSVVDLVAVADLAKVNGDLGRVAGLLKFWLAEKRGQGAKPIDVEAMITSFRVLQAQRDAARENQRHPA